MGVAYYYINRQKSVHVPAVVSVAMRVKMLTVNGCCLLLH